MKFLPEVYLDTEHEARVSAERHLLAGPEVEGMTPRAGTIDFNQRNCKRCGAISGITGMAVRRSWF